MTYIERAINGTAAPTLRIGLTLSTLRDLPAWSSGPRGELAAVLTQLRAAGIEAAQSHQPKEIHAIQHAGLIATALARVDKAEDARAIARRGREWGCECTTLHVGTGLETDEEALSLLSAIVDASAAESYPLFVETHRATVTQDLKRTLDFVVRLPELRFNADYSHWYTGSEMTYGFLDTKIDRLAPVTERTRFIHGRVSTPGCIQIPVRAGNQEAHVRVFRKLWTRSFAGFLADAQAGEIIGFYPELLPPSYHYARMFQAPSGEWREESDRWQEALHLIDIARECWGASLTDHARRAIVASHGCRK